jgi:hypothetical protein
MRGTCLDCVRKHLAQASALMDEAGCGYSFHKWYAVGHLAEAESECRALYPLFTQEIRECRLKIMNGETEPCFDQLIIKACRLAGEEVVLHHQNSKTF